MKNGNISRRKVWLSIATSAMLYAPAMQAGNSGLFPCIIPLQMVNIKPSNSYQPGYKLGIYAGLGGGSPKLYEFDTGGSGFWAASPPPSYAGTDWWGPNTTNLPNQQNTMSKTYASGNEYVANLVKTTVELYSQSNGQPTNPVCGSGATQLNVSQITSNRLDSQQWNDDLSNGAPPLQTAFYGNFGAALFPTLSTDSSSTKFAVYSILPQIVPHTPNLTNGFIVHVGALDLNANPTLQIGLTDSDLRSFPIQVPMTAPISTPGWVFPQTNAPTYRNQLIISSAMTLSQQFTSLHQPPFTNTDLIIDTGSIHPNFYQNSDTGLVVDPDFLEKPNNRKGSPLHSGVILQIQAAAASSQACPTNLNWTYSSTPNLIHAGYGNGRVNTGIEIFASYDIMFDLTHGIVGFRPIAQLSETSSRYTFTDYVFPSGVKTGISTVPKNENRQYYNGPIGQVYVAGQNTELVVAGTTLPPINATEFQQLYTIAIQGQSADWNVSAYYGMITLAHKTSHQIIRFFIPQPPPGSDSYGVDVLFNDGGATFTGNTAVNCRWTMWLAEGGKNHTGRENNLTPLPLTGNTPLDLANQIAAHPSMLNKANNSAPYF
jgi:hypothetical protein